MEILYRYLNASYFVVINISGRSLTLNPYRFRIFFICKFIIIFIVLRRNRHTVCNNLLRYVISNVYYTVSIPSAMRATNRRQVVYFVATKINKNKIA